MAATATESSSSCTWFGLPSGIAKIGVILVVGIGISMGAYNLALANGITPFNSTIMSFAASIGSSMLQIPTTIANFIGLGDAGSLTGAASTAGALADPATIEVAKTFGDAYADVTKSFAESHAKWNDYVSFLKNNNLYDNAVANEGFKKIELFFNSSSPESFVGTVDATVPDDLAKLKTEIGEMDALFKQVSAKSGYTLDGLETIAKAEPGMDTAKLKTLAEKEAAFRTAMTKTGTEIGELHQLHNSKVGGMGAPTSTAALATAAGAGAAATAGVAYLASGRGEPVGKHTQMLRDRDALRQAAYDEAMGQGVPVRG